MIPQPQNQFSKFDTVAAIANLSLTVSDLQTGCIGFQTAIQQIGQGLGQLMQANNALGKKVEELEKRIESLASVNTSKTEAQNICAGVTDNNVC